MATELPLIDSHAHVASPDTACYPRSDALAGAPRFDAPVEDLLQDMAAGGVGKAILIQPSSYGFDHSYLLACLQAHPGRFSGVVLADPDDSRTPERLAELVRRGPITGVRFAPLIDPKRRWFARETDALVHAIADLDLTICILISPSQLAEATRWIERHPQCRMVIDHLARPDLDPGRSTAVVDEVARLSEFANVSVKLSALSELSHESFPHADTGAWARRILAAFGPDRLMWGSDFPYVSSVDRYKESWEALCQALDGATESALHRIAAGTAAAVFRLDSLK